MSSGKRHILTNEEAETSRVIVAMFIISKFLKKIIICADLTWVDERDDANLLLLFVVNSGRKNKKIISLPQLC